MARIIAAFTLGVILGVLPLATAVIMGKPMQGSIGWGLSVISGNKTATGINIDTSGQNSSGTSSGGQSSDAAFGQQGEVQGDDAYNDEDGQNGTQSVKKLSFADKLKQKAGVVYYKFADLFGRAYRNLNNDIEAAVFPHGGDFYLGFVFISCAVLIIFGIIFGISRDYDYGGRIITVAFSIIFIHMMFIAGVFGLPKLMDQNRTRIYMTYSLAVLVALDFDIVPYIISRFINLKTLYNTISFAICVVAVIRVVDVYGLREPIVYSQIGMLESNGAVECLSNIIKENEDRTWTILSANDELRMMDKHGYHYEILDLLKDMKKNPDIMQKFTNALQKGMDYVQSHTPEEIAEVIKPQFPETELDTVTTIVKRYYDQDTWKENLVFGQDGFELLQDILEDAGELKERTPYAELVNTEFAQNAS